MHEEALYRDLRRKLQGIAHEEHAARISRVEVWIGALSHVQENALRARWAQTVEGTPAESAALRVVVSDDLNDPRARELVLTQVGVVDTDPTPAHGKRGLPRPQEGKGLYP